MATSTIKAPPTGATIPSSVISGSATVDAALTSLNDNIAILQDIFSHQTASGTSAFEKTFTASHSFLVISTATAETSSGVWIIHGTSSAMYVYTVKSASNFTITTSGLTVKWAKTNTATTKFFTIDLSLV